MRQTLNQRPRRLELRQEGKRHHRCLRQVDRRRRKRTSEKLEEQESAQGLRLFCRIAHVIDQLDRFRSDVPAILFSVSSGAKHVLHVVVAGGCARVAHHELRQRAANVLVKSWRTLPVQQSPLRRSVVGRQSDEFLEGFEAFLVHVIGEQLDGFDVQALVQLVLLVVLDSGFHRPFRECCAQFGRDLVGLVLPGPRHQRQPFVHPEELHLAVCVLGGHGMLAETHQRKVAGGLQALVLGHDTLDVIDCFFDARNTHLRFFLLAIEVTL